MADDERAASPGAPLPSFDPEEGPTLEVHLSDLDDADPTVPLRPARDAEDPATLRRPDPPFDGVVTTRLASAPVPIRFDPPSSPPSEQTRPFALVAPSLPSEPLASVPFPLVTLDPDAVQTARFPVIQDVRLAAPVLPMPYSPAPHAPPPPALPAPPAAGARVDSRALLAFTASVLATLALALVIVVAVVIVRRSGSRPQAAPPPARARSEAPAPAFGAAPSPAPLAPGCIPARPARKIAGSIQPAVPPTVAPAINPSEVAVGLAESRNTALGLVVDLEDLAAERRLVQSFTRPVFRTTPFERDGSVTFLIDHDDPRLLAARTVPAKAPFVVGVNYFGFVRAGSTGDPETLWPGGKGAEISAPMFASVADVGHAVAFVRGRPGGSAHVGWLTERGQAKTDLATLELTDKELGPPAIAAGERAIAVALATRADRLLPWRVHVATAGHGSLPRKLVPMSTGMGPDRSEPTLVALGGGGWLLSWIESAADGRRIRAQLLDADLQRLAAPFDIANEPGIELSRGALFRVGSRVLSFYVVRAENRYELWCAALACS
jgi:hypothetical protein